MIALNPGIKKVFAVAGIALLLFYFVPLSVAAASEIDCGWTDFPCGVLRAVNLVVDGLGWFLMLLPEKLFETALKFNTSDFIAGGGVVQAGWTISRDLINMFFLLILVIMALTTIFDVQTFNRKTALAKLLVVVLFINFSLAIGTFMIDRANELGNVFYAQIKTRGDISTSIRQMVDFRLAQSTLRGMDMNAEQVLAGQGPPSEAIKNFKWTYAYFDPKTVNTEHIELTYDICKGDNLELYTEGCSQWKTAARQSLMGTDIRTKLGMAILAKIVVYPVAAFVIIAGAWMLVRRVITLMYLLMLAPWAFAAYLAPAELPFGSWWKEWWKSLINQAFFYPAFLFTLMLAIFVMQEIQYNTRYISEGLLSYGFGIGLLFGSLIVASKMGAEGASAAVALGRKWGNNMKSKAIAGSKNFAWRQAQKPTEFVSKGLQKGLMYSPKSRFGRMAVSTTRGLISPAYRAATRGAEYLEQQSLAAVKAKSEKYEKMAPDQLATEMKHAITGDTRDTIMKAAAEKGDLAKFSPDQQEQIFQHAQMLQDEKKDGKAIRTLETSQPQLVITQYQNRLKKWEDARGALPATDTVATGAADREIQKIKANIARVASGIRSEAIDEGKVNQEIFSSENDPSGIVLDSAMRWNAIKLDRAITGMDGFAQKYSDKLNVMAAAGRETPEIAGLPDDDPRKIAVKKARKEFADYTKDRDIQKLLFTPHLQGMLGDETKSLMKQIERERDARRSDRRRGGGRPTPPAGGGAPTTPPGGTPPPPAGAPAAGGGTPITPVTPPAGGTPPPATP